MTKTQRMEETVKNFNEELAKTTKAFKMHIMEHQGEFYLTFNPPGKDYKDGEKPRGWFDKLVLWEEDPALGIEETIVHLYRGYSDINLEDQIKGSLTWKILTDRKTLRVFKPGTMEAEAAEAFCYFYGIDD